MAHGPHTFCLNHSHEGTPKLPPSPPPSPQVAQTQHPLHPDMSSTRRRRDRYYPASSSSSLSWTAAHRDHNNVGPVIINLSLCALALSCVLLLRYVTLQATGGAHNHAAKTPPQYPHQAFVVDWPHSFRDIHLMEKDQACVRAGHGYVHLLHMREAGGTSLLEVLLGKDGDSSSRENRPPLKLFHSMLLGRVMQKEANV